MEFASWPWTLPTPAANWNRRSRPCWTGATLHEMRFFLMHNIQYDGLDGVYENPMGAVAVLSRLDARSEGAQVRRRGILETRLGRRPANPRRTPSGGPGSSPI